MAEQLAAERHIVRALVRPKSDRRVLERLPVEFAAGAIEDRASLAGALEDVDAVVHVAGIVCRTALLAGGVCWERPRAVSTAS